MGRKKKLTSEDEVSEILDEVVENENDLPEGASEYNQEPEQPEVKPKKAVQPKKQSQHSKFDKFKKGKI